MRLKLKHFIILTIFATIVTSCGNTSDVISGNIIQNRKYRSGFFISNNHKKNVVTNANENIIIQHPNKEILDDIVDNKCDQPFNQDISYIEELDLVSSKNKIMLASSINEEVIFVDNEEDDYVREKESNSNNILALIEGAEEATEDDVYHKELFSIIGTVVGIFGVLTQYGTMEIAMIASFSFGAIALIFALISIIRRKKHPDRFRGKGWVTVAIILGLLAFVRGIISATQL